MTRSLSEIEGFEIAAEGSSGEDAVRIAGTLRPDILLMDIYMPAGGLDAIPAVLDVAPSQKIVMLTVSEASEDVTTALDRGAMGYVLKGVGAHTLADAIRTVAAGEGYVAPTLSARLISARAQTATASKPALVASLTPREMQVLELVAIGMSNKHMAIKLDLREKTVKHHMTQIFTKLGVANRTEAAMALRDVLGS